MEKRFATEQGPTEKKGRMLDGGTQYKLCAAKHREALEKHTGHTKNPYMSLNAEYFKRTGKLAELKAARKMKFKELEFILKYVYSTFKCHL